jgi:hypothetical protein
MQPATGRSLTDLFTSEQSGQVNPARDHVLIGQERHDVGRPRDVGYPIRGIVKGGLLYLHNFEPTRWPACNPETGYLNCDGSPTKTQILELRRQGTDDRFWQLAFGKRPSEELYDVRHDRECLKNLVVQGGYEELKDGLREQLERELRDQQDPRMFGQGHIFDEYRYADETTWNFYERYNSGEKVRAGWIEASDFEPQPLD